MCLGQSCLTFLAKSFHFEEKEKGVKKSRFYLHRGCENTFAPCWGLSILSFADNTLHIFCSFPREDAMSA